MFDKQINEPDGSSTDSTHGWGGVGWGLVWGDVSL